MSGCEGDCEEARGVRVCGVGGWGLPRGSWLTPPHPTTLPGLPAPACLQVREAMAAHEVAAAARQQQEEAARSLSPTKQRIKELLAKKKGSGGAAQLQEAVL